MSAEDLKTSILVKRQVPEFIKEEYPKFITFLEAYYDFLEAPANTAVTSNNLITTSKSLRDIGDVDESIDKFEKNFYNTYASLIPLSVQSNKSLLFKHIVNLYRSKGTENSFKLLFQLLFGNDIDLTYPRNNVLRPSASDWRIDKILKINKSISSRYIGDGETTIFYFAQNVEEDEFTVFVDGIEKDLNVHYYIIKEYRQLVFFNAPANESVITVEYADFNSDLLNNRKVTGLSSGASAIVEIANEKLVSDFLNLGLPIELSLNEKTLAGVFTSGELLSIPIVDAENDIVIDIRASSFSIVKKINVINGGNNYSVGDSVTIFGGNAISNAVATVATIKSGVIDTIQNHHGGAGFFVTTPISVSGNGPLDTMTVFVDAIDASGANAANSITISPDSIANLTLNSGVVRINSTNFGTVFSKANVNGSTLLKNAFNYISFQVGPISNSSVLVSTIPISDGGKIVLDAAGALFGLTTSPLRSTKSYRSIGRYKINNGGANYQIGDEIIFGSNPIGTYGQHGAATVASVNATGSIVRIDSAPPRIRGTGAVSSGVNEVNGTGTFFTQDLRVGDIISVNNESRSVSIITNDTRIEVNTDFNFTSTSRKIGVFNRWPTGGYGYEQNNFPTITVSSVAGIGADVQIDSLIGDGERLSATGFGANGQITSIVVTDPGSAYEYIPTVQIEGGDETATANAEIDLSFISAPGRWLTSDSLLSSFDRKLQGSNYYVDYSYVIESQIEFTKYKTLLRKLLHPVGLVNYAVYKIENVVELTDTSVEKSKEVTISGLVNISNGGMAVTGINTKFVTACTKNLMIVGDSILIKDQIRTVNTIVSNTRIATTSNVINPIIVNRGSNYVNGNIIFANGGATVTSLTVDYAGQGYENGSVVFSGSDEGISASATVEVYPSNGAIKTIRVNSGGLFNFKPNVRPSTLPYRVLYANGISILTDGEGYSNGTVVFSGGSPVRSATGTVEVYPSNGAIRTITITDPGLYQGAPSISFNTSPNVVVSAFSVSQSGNGHSNGTVVFSGGSPKRAADVFVEVYPSNSKQVVTVTANTNAHAANGFIVFSGAGNDNVGANARIYVNSTGAIVNVVVLNRGLYTSTSNPTASVRRGVVSNAVFTVTTLSLDGQIRKFIINDPGIYSSTPSATLNSTPRSVSFVSSNTVANTFAGRIIANGYLIFSGGVAVRPANATYQVYPSNGVINMRSIMVTDAGLYRVPPTSVAPNVVPVSVTQVLVNAKGLGYVNGNVVFSTGQGTANIIANCTVTVNALGAIDSTTLVRGGLYANGNDIIIVGILNPVTATLQSPTYPASFTIGHNANTTNVANLVITTAANTSQTAVVSVIANSNSITNATFSVSIVANSQTTADISVGFTGKNTPAIYGYEIFPPNTQITSVSVNAGAVGVNSWINFSGPRVDVANAANARIYVNTRGYIINVTMYANGMYSGLPIIGNVYGNLTYNTNTVPISTHSYTNAVFTITTQDFGSNGAIRRINSYNLPGDYYYTPNVVLYRSEATLSTYSLAYTGTNAYTGGVLAPNNEIYLVPGNAPVGQKISISGVASTYSLVYTTTNAYIGGVLSSNSDIHFVPYNARRGQKISSTGQVSTYSLAYTTTDAYAGGVLTQKGEIHFVPHNSKIGQKVISTGIVSTYSLRYTSGIYHGGVLSSNGEIHFVPHTSDRGQKISADGVASTYSLVYTTTSAYVGGVLSSNGEIHFVPFDATIGQKVSSNGGVFTYSLVYTTSDAYAGGVVAPNGEIHFVPYKARVGQKVSAVGVVSTYSLAYTTTDAYFGGVLSSNNDIHFVPYNARVGQEAEFNANGSGAVITFGSVSWDETATLQVPIILRKVPAIYVETENEYFVEIEQGERLISEASSE
jgi:hypothetical protein